ncbi:hypothetical protein LTR62_007286 [Meristemomyces frigidus]|uniref:NAD(P)-binding domain-containing protein n=1 Tax=Meristemomyces frigidus TaxID=1508187 RepID=A0AAN7TEN1_9PEZI|nr:hypothetical protein LTR62_007286 [Meristemomyces frigidus]
MRVLLLGSTGRVGARLLPALLAHGHTVVVYMRNADRLPKEYLRRGTTVVEGCATNTAAIKSAILRNECGAVVNTAGRASILGTNRNFADIFTAVTSAAVEVQQERRSPLRCWLLSGWPILDNPKTGLPLLTYLRTHSTHRINYDRIRHISTSQAAWSLFCASNMLPRTASINIAPKPGIAMHSLESVADQPPQWTDSLFHLPLIGPHLNVAAQIQSYFSPLEDCMDFIAEDLKEGLNSQWIGQRVGVKAKEEWDVGPWSWMNSLSDGTTWGGAVWKGVGNER